LSEKRTPKTPKAKVQTIQNNGAVTHPALPGLETNQQNEEDMDNWT
jgi:hypothetical protein